jgi:hypothetical protein
MLEEGDEFLSDCMAVVKGGFFDNGREEGGRLRLSTKGITFQPDNGRAKVIRIPFRENLDKNFAPQKRK